MVIFNFKIIYIVFYGFIPIIHPDLEDYLIIKVIKFILSLLCNISLN
jgi:hypothetical protein